MANLARLWRQYRQKQRDRSELRSMDALQENDLALSKADIAALVESRPGVRAQLVEMARQFGVVEAEIDNPRWRALEIVHACTNCAHAKSCYRYLSGQEDTGFDPETCPNAERYEEIAGGN